MKVKTFIAVVENPYSDADVVDVRDLSGTLFTGVRKRAAIGAPDRGFLITPAAQSTVLVCNIEESDELFIEMFSEVESVVIDGGEHGGLINIADLTDKLNALVDAFNNHTHTVSTTGSAAAQTGTAAAITSKAQAFKAGDYENTKIKH